MGIYMKKRNIKKILTWIIVPLMVAIFLLDIVTVVLGNKYSRSVSFGQETFTLETGDDRIHFLNTANSDAILLESNGRFALVDSGEGDNNPRRETEYEGYEEEVIAYLKKVAADKNGKVMLDFILGTHCHYDHVGSFEAIITDPDILIGKAYFKEFDVETAKDYEVKSWLINETYNRIISALTVRNIDVISDIPVQMEFGDFSLDLFNTVTPKELAGEGENASSIGIKVTKGEKTAFLAADFTKSCGLEQIYEDKIGDVDLLKAGHHGYFGSSSKSFLSKLKPEIIIITNQLGKVYPNVKWNFTMSAKAPFFATYDSNGIIATFTDDGKILMTDNIH